MFDEKITFDKFIRWFLVAALIFAVFYVLNYLSHVLLPFFIAWFIAYLLNPVVKFVQYKLRVKVRAIAVIITMLLVVTGISCVVYAIVPPMIDQAERLGDAANKYVLHTANGNRIMVMVREWIQEYLPQIRHYLNSADFTATIKNSIPKLFSFLGQTASIVISIIASFITLLYLFFILLDYERLVKNFIRIFPKGQRPFWTDLMQDVEVELNNYIRGQGLVGLTLIPYMHALAFIPMIFLSLIKAVDTGQNFWVVFGTATLVFAIIQLICDLIVTPKIMGKAMNLNPAILLLSLSVWGSLLGFIGLIIALPLTTLIIAYWKRYVTKEEKVGEVGMDGKLQE